MLVPGSSPLSARRAVACLCASSLLLLTGCGGDSTAASSPSSAAQHDATVTRVVDGDTIEVKTADGAEKTVRLLNIDTPETVDPQEPVQCLGPEASAFLKEQLTEGTGVDLTYDVEEKDRYGRDLAVVSTDSTSNISVDIARAGFGLPLGIAPNTTYLPPVQAASEEARAAGKGLFDSSNACTPAARTEKTVQAVDDALALGTGDEDAAHRSYVAVAAALAAARSLIAEITDHPDYPWPEDLRKQLEQRRNRAQARKQQLTEMGADQDPAQRRAAEQRQREQEQAAAEQRAAEQRAAEQAAAERSAAEQREAEQRRAEAAEREAVPEAPGQQQEQQQPAPAPRQESSTDGQGYGTDADYPGYHGRRCYAPGGKRWKPC